MLLTRNGSPGASYLRRCCLFGVAALAFALFGVVGAYIIAASPGASIAEGAGQTLPYLVSPWMLSTEAITISFLLYGYLFVRSSPWKALDATTMDGLLRRQRARFLLVLGLFALSLIGVGGIFALELEREAHRQALAQTQTIARLKAQQVDK